MKVLKHIGLCDGEISQYNLKEMLPGETENEVVNVHDLPRHEIFGFGGAFTEAAGYTYAQMSDELKKQALEILFGKDHLHYTFCRLCIGSSDFGLGEFSEVADGDDSLESFNIDRDKKYVIPFVKDALAYTNGGLTLFASPWSPPAFMKDTNQLKAGGKLLKKYYGLYAQYFVKFIEAYEAEGIHISAVTMQNEAHAVQTWESCVFDGNDEAEFCETLYDAFEKAGLKVGIFCWDHNKERLYERASEVFTKAQEKIAGISFHWYSGEHYDEIRLVRELFPDKAIIEGEFCRGLSSSGYMRYRDDMLENLAAGANALVDWNLILDENGGPFHNRPLGCKGELCYDTVKKELRTHDFHKDMFMFSHYIEPGAKVLASSSFSPFIKVLGVKNPDGKVLVYLNNRGLSRISTVLRFENYEYPVTVENNAIALLIIEP